MQPVRIAAAPEKFRKLYRKKSPANQRAVERAIERMEADLSHHSLRARPYRGKENIWEAYASDAVRISFEFVDADTIRMRKCNGHEVHRSP